MESNLGDFLRAERAKQGLSLGQLARQIGYRNLTKGIRRITCLERTGLGKNDLVVNVVDALDLDWDTVERLAEADHLERLREWERWVNEPVPMCLVVRMMAAVYARHTLPVEITNVEEAEAWACEFARKHCCRVCLIVSRRLSVRIDSQGRVEARAEATPDALNVPFMEVKGRRFLLEG